MLPRCIRGAEDGSGRERFAWRARRKVCDGSGDSARRDSGSGGHGSAGLSAHVAQSVFAELEICLKPGSTRTRDTTGQGRLDAFLHGGGNQDNRLRL